MTRRDVAARRSWWVAARSRTSAERSLTSPMRRKRFSSSDLEHPGLDLQIDVADLVEEQRSDCWPRRAGLALLRAPR